MPERSTTSTHPRQEPPIFSASKAIEKFSPEYAAELDILDRMGLLPYSSPRTLADPFSSTEVQEDFRNIGEHCLAVAWCAQVLGQLLVSRHVLDSNELKFTVKRALLHDAIKPFDIFLARAAKSGALPLESLHRADIFNPVKDVLIGMGFEPGLANTLVDDFGIETGTHAWQRFLIGDQQLGCRVKPGNWPEKIVLLADGMTCTGHPNMNTSQSGSVALTQFMDPETRHRISNIGVKYPWGESRCLATMPEGEIKVFARPDEVPPEGHLIGSLHATLLILARHIGHEIKAAANINGPQEACELLRDLVVGSLTDL